MAVTAINVNYNSIFSNGTLTAVSSGAAVWSDVVRLADGFIQRLATTDIAPTGLTEIKIDQTIPGTLAADRLIIPVGHNLGGITLTLEHASSDSWPGTAAVLTPAIPTAGALFSATFTRVTPAPGNKWWRLSFTKTDAAIQIPELWLTETIELGVSETTEDGNAVAPMAFPLRPNILVHRTLEGVRSAVEQGATLRGLTVTGESLTATAFADWETFLTAISNGLKAFYIDDPRGVTWFAEVVSSGDISRDLDAPERWTITLQIQEVP